MSALAFVLSSHGAPQCWLCAFEGMQQRNQIFTHYLARDIAPSVPIRSCDTLPRGLAGIVAEPWGWPSQVLPECEDFPWGSVWLPVPCLALGLRGLWRKRIKKNKKEGFGGLQSRNVIQLYELVFTFLAEWIEQKLLRPNIHMMIHVMAYKLVVFH